MKGKLLIGIAAAILSVGTLPSTAQVLLDYRDEAFLSGSPFYSAAEQSAIAAALQQAPAEIAGRFAEGFVIRGDAVGTFTQADAKERIFLIQDEAANSIEPFPETGAPMLLVMRGAEPVGFELLPGDVQYQRLVAAADVDGDGRDEVFLETSFVNMGQTMMSVDVAAIGTDGTAKIVETLNDVYVDGCDNPVGERLRTASTISVEDGLNTQSFDEPCPE